MPYDISIVLNVHNEGELICPTLRSLGETIAHAGNHGLKSELVIVLDNPDAATRRVIDTYDFALFKSVKKETICVKSLGLARNHGIRAAAGRYIATADADDLVCVNYLHALYTRLAQTSEKTFAFPEYYHAFGCDSFVARLCDLRDVGIYRLAGGHPYVSRIMARREDLLTLGYTDCANDLLYAFEDYDLNLRAVAAGFDFVVASNAVVFYRQRPDSIMRTLSGRKLARNCDFFAPDIFLSLMKEQDKAPAKIATHYDFSHSYTNSSYINSLIYYANRIDPEVQPISGHEKKFFTMLGMSEDFGRAYGEICRRFGNKHYTDVFLMPFLSREGAEKYILNFIRSAMKDPTRSCLLVLGQYLEPEKARSTVPKGLDVIDLGALLPLKLMSLTSEMTLRVIENLAPTARVFLKFCPYSEQLMADHGAFLAPHEVVYFYFCSSFHSFEGCMYEDGAELRFMRENRGRIDHVISDHQRNLDELVYRVPSYRGHTTALYACASEHAPLRSDAQAPRRLIWASRLDRQKRPDILRRIALELSSSKDAPDILVYGSAVLDSFDIGFFTDCPNVTYMGGFAGLDSIPFTDQDAFLYTSLFDGMPNIILEAIEKKVPIISVNVGGISELLTEDTAFLVRETADDRDLILRYVEQIERFMDCPADELRQRVERLYGKYSRQHEARIYDKKVSEIYSLFHKG